MADHPVRLPCCGETDMTWIRWDRTTGAVSCSKCGARWMPEPGVVSTTRRSRQLMAEVNNFLRATFPAEDGRLAWLTGLELLARDEKVFDIWDLQRTEPQGDADDG